MGDQIHPINYGRSVMRLDRMGMVRHPMSSAVKCGKQDDKPQKILLYGAFIPAHPLTSRWALSDPRARPRRARTRPTPPTGGHGTRDRDRRTRLRRGPGGLPLGGVRVATAGWVGPGLPVCLSGEAGSRCPAASGIQGRAVPAKTVIASRPTARPVRDLRSPTCPSHRPDACRNGHPVRVRSGWSGRGE